MNSERPEDREGFLPMAPEDRALALSNETSLWLNVAKFEQTQRVAQMLSKSTFVPNEFRGNIGNCMVALDLAERMKAHPIMLMQTMYIVHGRPGFEGKLLSALVNNSGRYTDPLEYEWKGEQGTPEWGCRAYATRKSTGKKIVGPWVDWKMVMSEGWHKPKGSQPSKWSTMPELMFMYRSASFFVNANDSDLKLGMQTVEELEDTHKELVRAPDGTYTAGDGEKTADLYKPTETVTTPEDTFRFAPSDVKLGMQTPVPNECPLIWQETSWRNLKSPGMVKIASENEDTFRFAPSDVREAFKKKWESCKDLASFPFDDDGFFSPPVDVVGTEPHPEFFPPEADESTSIRMDEQPEPPPIIFQDEEPKF